MTNYLNLIFITIILIQSHKSRAQPDMCTHSARFDSLTQYIRYSKGILHIEFFFTSGGYYWTVNQTTFPTPNNTRGLLPDNFRGDAAYFRQWRDCYDNSSVPMIVVVDNDPKYFKNLKYIKYYINNQTWSKPSNITEDLALKSIHIYKDMKSVDTIINFANVKVGPFASQLGDESIFVFTTALNNTQYYDWVRLNGCVRSDGVFDGTVIQMFGGLLSTALWPMNKSVDAAMVYTEYPSGPPISADINLFEENTHYIFSCSLQLITNGFLFALRDGFSVQYYSTFLDCALGATPEPPILPPFITTFSTIPSGQTEDTIWTELTANITSSRPTFETDEESLVHDQDKEDKGITNSIIISVSLVVSVVVILVIIFLLMYWFGLVLTPEVDKDVEIIEPNVGNKNELNKTPIDSEIITEK